MKTALIILAAGKGTRMNSDLPKVLHPIAGEPMLIHALEAGTMLEPERTVAVAGHGAELVRSAALAHDATIKVVEQTEQLGTAHAVAQARDALSGFDGMALVLYGDTPFIRPETLENMQAALAANDVVVLGFEAADPARYGRLVMDGQQLDRIVEFKDASDDERMITLCNSGVVACNADLLFDLIDAVDNNNASEEYYLTDIVGLARGRGLVSNRCHLRRMGNRRHQLSRRTGQSRGRLPNPRPCRTSGRRRDAHRPRHGVSGARYCNWPRYAGRTQRGLWSRCHS
ncbi:Bifunctional protein GlmU [Nymphon striatum]|nr:Bifunctional protein GlmU [Nymphon striatum]